MRFLKLTRSRNLNHKKSKSFHQVYMRRDKDKIYDTYVEIDDDLQLNVNIYNALVAKTYV